MLVSRRAFLQLVIAVPAVATVYAADYKKSLQSEFITDPVEIHETTSEFQEGVFSTSKRTIHGPAAIFELLTSGDGGDVFLTRDNGNILMSYSIHHLAIFRWVACPNSEIWVPEGTSVHLNFVPREDFRMRDKDQSFMPWMMYTKTLKVMDDAALERFQQSVREEV